MVVELNRVLRRLWCANPPACALKICPVGLSHYIGDTNGSLPGVVDPVMALNGSSLGEARARQPEPQEPVRRQAMASFARADDLAQIRTIGASDGHTHGVSTASRFRSTAALLAVGLLASCGGDSTDGLSDSGAAGVESRQDPRIPSPVSDAPDARATALWWDETAEAEGSVGRVCGPLAGADEIDEGLFLNLGQDYPRNDRFTFVIWSASLAELAADVRPGATLCASGLVTLFEGVPQIELAHPSAVEVIIEAEAQDEAVSEAEDLVYFEWAEYPYQRPPALPGEVAWENAANRAGSVDLVCGPLAGFDDQDGGVLISLGNPYPNPNRFMLAVQGFTEEVVDMHGEYVPTVCGGGEIQVHDGIPAMVITPNDAWFKAANGSLLSLFAQ